MQRESLWFSERALAFKMKRNAMRRQAGIKADGPLKTILWARSRTKFLRNELAKAKSVIPLYMAYRVYQKWLAV